MKNNSENDIFEILDQVNLNEVSEFIEEENIIEAALKSSDLKRIMLKTYNKIGTGAKHRYKLELKTWRNVAAVILVATICLVIFSPFNVRAGVQKLLYFIPGFGITDSTDKFEDKYILKSPLEKSTSNGDVIKIKGIVSYSKGIYITVTGIGDIEKNHDIFLNQNGNKYRLDERTSSNTRNTWYGIYAFEGQVDNPQLIDLVVSNKDKTNFKVHLEKAKGSFSYEDIGPTRKVNDIAITAVASRESNKIRVNLFSPNVGTYKITDYSLSDNKLVLEDDNGIKQKITKDSLSYNNEFYFYPNLSANGHFKLTIPKIVIEYTDNEDIILNIPKSGISNVNKNILVAGFPVTVNQIERVSEEKINIYLNTNFNEKTKENLQYFTPGLIDCLPSKSSSSGSCFIKLNNKTGAVEAFNSIEIYPDTKKVKFKANNIKTVKEGPWVIDINTNKIHLD